MNKDYKRLTIRNDDGTWGVNYLELANEVAKWQEQHATQCLSTDLTNILGEKLADFEDKIENGTLVELDESLIGEEIIGIHHFTDGTYQLDFDENIVIGFAIDGVITWNNTHHFNDEFRNGMFFMNNEKGKAEAEAKVRELKGERLR